MLVRMGSSGYGCHDVGWVLHCHWHSKCAWLLNAIKDCVVPFILYNWCGGWVLCHAQSLVACRFCGTVAGIALITVPRLVASQQVGVSAIRHGAMADVLLHGHADLLGPHL